MSISENGVPQITPDEAAQRVEAGAFLLDVREDDEWEAGHAPGAHHLPLARVQTEHDALPEDGEIVVICRAGGRSEQAAIALRGAGYEAINIAGGMRAWSAAGLPVARDDGEVGTVI